MSFIRNLIFRTLPMGKFLLDLTHSRDKQEPLISVQNNELQS